MRKNFIMKEKLETFFGEDFICQTTENKIIVDLTEMKNGIRQNECKLKLESKGSFIEINDEKFQMTGNIFTKNAFGLQMTRTSDGIVILENKENMTLLLIEYKEKIGRRTFFSEICKQLDATYIKSGMYLNLFSPLENVKVIYIAVGKLIEIEQYK